MLAASCGCRSAAAAVEEDRAIPLFYCGAPIALAAIEKGAVEEEWLFFLLLRHSSIAAPWAQ